MCETTIFYLSLAIAIKEGQATLDDVKRVLNNAFPELSFDNLKSVKFVGDGTYLQFSDKYVEIRPSGTDAKTKAYSGGEDLATISKYAQILGNYSGERTKLHQELISVKFYNDSKETALNHYLKFVAKGEDTSKFNIPEYIF